MATMTSTRDVMVVLLGSAMIRMEGDKLTVGQTVDLLMKMLDREGYEITKKQNTTIFHVGGGPLP
jgi:DNA gyrase inhibitor GyrI